MKMVKFYFNCDNKSSLEKFIKRSALKYFYHSGNFNRSSSVSFIKDNINIIFSSLYRMK